MINIIMPAYNAHSTIRQAIGSIVMQDDLDNILLTIVDDCSDMSYDYLLNDFHYMNIEILRKQTNTGCGQSRQYGIDHCKCTYFMFLDTDDVLYSPDAVKKMVYYMDTEKLDFLYTDFIEEQSDDAYLLHQNDGVWMHGKMFRTKYIQENNIRYSNTRLHEDHSFNIISNAVGGKNLYVDYTTYVWKKNPNSLTNSKTHTFVYAMENFLANAEYTIIDLCNRNIDKSIVLAVIKAYIFSFYKYYNSAFCCNVPEMDIQTYLYKIRKFCAIIPERMKHELTMEFLTQQFCENRSIQSMYDNNIIFYIGFEEYYNFIHEALYSK